MSRMPLPSIITAVLLIVVLLVYGLTDVVRFSEVAVRVRLGQADESSIIREPGLIFPRWPVIERYQKYDVRLRTLQTAETEIKTRDGQNLIIGCYAMWKIEDPLKFFKRVNEVREAEQVLRQRIEEARATVVGRYDMSQFFSPDREQVYADHEAIAGEMLDAAKDSVARDYGVKLVRVGIRRIALPEETTRVVQEAMKAERTEIANGLQAEGQGRAQKIRARAESQSAQILAFADRKAQEIESEGVAASVKIFEQLADSDTAFYITLRWIDAVETIFAQRTTVFIDSDTALAETLLAPPRPGELRAQDLGRELRGEMPSAISAPAPAADESAEAEGE